MGFETRRNEDGDGTIPGHPPAAASLRLKSPPDRQAAQLRTRQGVVVPQRTRHRYALQVLEVGQSAPSTTVRLADGEPGAEDFTLGALNGSALQMIDRRVLDLTRLALPLANTVF